jgi:hypothetical protein
MARLMLQAPGRLAEALAQYDVRIVLCGHYHHESLGTAGAVPVWVGPATAYRADVTSTDAFRGVAGGAISRVDLAPAGPTVSVIPIPEG